MKKKIITDSDSSGDEVVFLCDLNVKYEPYFFYVWREICFSSEEGKWNPIRTWETQAPWRNVGVIENCLMCLVKKGKESHGGRVVLTSSGAPASPNVLVLWSGNEKNCNIYVIYWNFESFWKCQDSHDQDFPLITFSVSQKHKHKNVCVNLRNLFLCHYQNISSYLFLYIHNTKQDSVQYDTKLNDTTQNHTMQ